MDRHHRRNSSRAGPRPGRELKRGDGSDILVFGSRTACTNLLCAGLVDELHLMVGLVVLGDV